MGEVVGIVVQARRAAVGVQAVADLLPPAEVVAASVQAVAVAVGAVGVVGGAALGKPARSIFPSSR